MAIEPGVVAVIQTFGDLINLHPHLHFLATEGGVDRAGVFHLVPRIDDSRLEEIFVCKVLAFLVRKELLKPEWAEPPLLAAQKLTFVAERPAPACAFQDLMVADPQYFP